jgi:hypothetical protein
LGQEGDHDPEFGRTSLPGVVIGSLAWLLPIHTRKESPGALRRLETFDPPETTLFRLLRHPGWVTTPPRFEPMLATSGRIVGQAQDYAFEPKWDGGGRW